MTGTCTFICVGVTLQVKRNTCAVFRSTRAYGAPSSDQSALRHPTPSATRLCTRNCRQCRVSIPQGVRRTNDIFNNFSNF
eukprot:COSAG06_NODE_58182_length_278_cov_0.502793_1_plen_79_part_10